MTIIVGVALAAFIVLVSIVFAAIYTFDQI